MGITVCVGGLIATGKTTFLNKLSEHCHKREINYHLMGELYGESMRKMVSTNLYAGDAFIYGHRMQMAFDAPLIAKTYDLVLMERSFIDHIAFYESFQEMGVMPPEHVELVKQIADDLAPPIPEHFVYLDVTPEISVARKQARGHRGDHIFNLEFTKALRKNYLRIIREYYKQPLILDWTSFGRDLCLDDLLQQFLPAMAH